MKIKQVLRIEFPCLPYRELQTNELRTVHWTVRRDVEEAARQEAYLMGRALDLKSPIEFYDLEIIFIAKDKRLHDLDSLICGAKAWCDGLIVPNPPKSFRSKPIIGAGVISKDDCWHMRKLTASACLGESEKTIIIIREIPNFKIYPEYKEE
ncbi:MAG: hypothetical protein PHU23_18570 [Dehalococcoidales bacterium]|nr:hypothetical protein [Dehalococcoidales bacterium]